MLSLAVLLVLTCAPVPPFATGVASPPSKDWVRLWQRGNVAMPAPITTHVGAGELGGLGEDLENRDWQTVSTGHHQLYFQPSADMAKVADLYRLLDGLTWRAEGRPR